MGISSPKEVVPYWEFGESLLFTIPHIPAHPNPPHSLAHKNVVWQVGTPFVLFVNKNVIFTTHFAVVHHSKNIVLHALELISDDSIIIVHSNMTWKQYLICDLDTTASIIVHRSDNSSPQELSNFATMIMLHLVIVLQLTIHYNFADQVRLKNDVVIQMNFLFDAMLINLLSA